MTLTIFDTGTSPPDQVSDHGVQIIHRPALTRRGIEVDREHLSSVLQTPSHLVFYSQFAVRQTIEQRLIARPGDHHFWAVGSHTGGLLASHFGVTPHVPDASHFQALKDRLLERGPTLPLVSFGLRGKRRDLSALAATWQVNWTCIDIYASTPADPATLRRAFDDHRPQWLTLTSSRGVQSVVDAIGTSALHRARDKRGLRFAAIGPSTAATASELGLAIDLVPESTGRQRLIEAVIDHSATTDPPSRP